MKITDVECLVLDRSFPFVRVFTDEGIGTQIVPDGGAQ